MARVIPTRFIMKATDLITGPLKSATEAMAELAGISKISNNNFNEMEGGTDGLQQSLEGLGQRMKGLGTAMTIGLTVPMATLAVQFTKVASNAQETANKFKEVFSNVKQGTQSKAVEELTKSYGFANATAKDYLSTSGLILQGLDLTEKKSLEASLMLSKLAADTASFRNVVGGSRRVMSGFTGALVGEREKLKSLGIVIREADVRAEALLMHQKGATFQTVKQAKALATLSLIQKRTAKDQGDFARTQFALSNLIRQAAELWKEVSATIGRLFLPYAEAAVKKINQLQKWFTNLNEAEKNQILKIAGIIAVLGPLLLLFGFLLTLLAPTISAFVSLAFTAAIIAVSMIALSYAFSSYRVAAISAIKTTLLLTAKFLLLTLAVGLVVYGIYKLIRLLPDIRDTFIGIAMSIAEAWGPFLDRLKVIYDIAKKVIGLQFSKVAASWGFGGDAGSPAGQVGRDIAETRATNDARVQLDFNNVPRGTRTAIESTGIPPTLNLGFSGVLL